MNFLKIFIPVFLIMGLVNQSFYNFCMTDRCLGVAFPRVMVLAMAFTGLLLFFDKSIIGQYDTVWTYIRTTVLDHKKKLTIGALVITSLWVSTGLLVVVFEYGARQYYDDNVVACAAKVTQKQERRYEASLERYNNELNATSDKAKAATLFKPWRSIYINKKQRQRVCRHTLRYQYTHNSTIYKVLELVRVK